MRSASAPQLFSKNLVSAFLGGRIKGCFHDDMEMTDISSLVLELFSDPGPVNGPQGLHRTVDDVVHPDVDEDVPS